MLSFVQRRILKIFIKKIIYMHKTKSTIKSNVRSTKISGGENSTNLSSKQNLTRLQMGKVVLLRLTKLSQSLIFF